MRMRPTPKGQLGPGDPRGAFRTHVMRNTPHPARASSAPFEAAGPHAPRNGSDEGGASRTAASLLVMAHLPRLASQSRHAPRAAVHGGEFVAPIATNSPNAARELPAPEPTTAKWGVLRAPLEELANRSRRPHPATEPTFLSASVMPFTNAGSTANDRARAFPASAPHQPLRVPVRRPHRPPRRPRKHRERDRREGVEPVGGETVRRGRRRSRRDRRWTRPPTRLARAGTRWPPRARPRRP